MPTLIKMTWEELQERLSQHETVQTIDLGAVQLHLAAGMVLLENPTSDNDCAEVSLSA